MSLLSDHAARLQRALVPLADSATYRGTEIIGVRAAALTAIGATSITFNTVPAAFTATQPGDTFRPASTTYTITNAVSNVGGVLTGVTFSPALTAQIAINTQINITRTTDHPIKAFVEQIDGLVIMGSVYAGGDFRVTIFNLPIEPTATQGHKIIWKGKTLTVASGIGRDPAGAAWIVQAKGT